MLIKVLKIDSEGLFLEDVILQDDEELPNDCIETLCPEGFYSPKWDGEKWIEGKTQAEIDTIKNTPQPKSQIEILQETIDMLIISSLGV